jgi:hypothetical protein
MIKKSACVKMVERFVRVKKFGEAMEKKSKRPISKTGSSPS